MSRSILAVLDDLDKSAAFIDTVLAQAEWDHSHVTFQLLTSGPLLTANLAPFGALYVPDGILAAEADERVDRLRRMVEKSPVTTEVLGLHDDVAWLAGDLRKASVLADLAVIGAMDCWQVSWLYRRVAETLALTSGAPLIIVPPGRSVTAVNHAVFCWKPTPQAARALHDLAAIAEPGARIDVVSLGRQPADNYDARSHHQVVDYLNRLGFQPNAVWLDRDGRTADTLQVYALEAGAELLVAGAFAHTRVREVVFGGVTEALIGAPRLPILLSH